MRKELVLEVNKQIANFGVGYVKFHNLHWNVVGGQFKPVHEYLESLYDSIADVLDVNMKNSVVLVNEARGAVVDEEALTEAVENGKIGGIGIDVYSTEPFRIDHPFSRILGNPRVLLTPHMAWGSAEARARCVNIIANNIYCFYNQKSQRQIR